MRRRHSVPPPFFIFINSLVITCLLQTRVVKANGHAFSDIMVNTKLLPRSAHFSIPFSKRSQWINPLAWLHSGAAMWFYASKNLLMGVGCCFLVTDVFNSLFDIPRLVPEQPLWSGRSSKAASAVSPGAFGYPPSKDGRRGPRLPVFIFPGTRAQTRLTISQWLWLAFWLGFSPFPVCVGERSGWGRRSEVRLLPDWERRCHRKDPAGRGLSPIQAVPTATPPGDLEESQGVACGPQGDSPFVLRSFPRPAFTRGRGRNDLCPQASQKTLRATNLRSCNRDFQKRGVGSAERASRSTNRKPLTKVKQRLTKQKERESKIEKRAGAEVHNGTADSDSCIPHPKGKKRGVDHPQYMCKY